MRFTDGDAAAEGQLDIGVDEVREDVARPMRGTEGESVSVRDADALLALMGRTNAALPDDHPRKITQRDVAILAALIDVVDRHVPAEAKLGEMADALRAKLAALLPAG